MQDLNVSDDSDMEIDKHVPAPIVEPKYAVHTEAVATPAILPVDVYHTVVSMPNRRSTKRRSTLTQVQAPPKRGYDEVPARANPVVKMIFNNYHHGGPSKRAKKTPTTPKLIPTTEEFASFSAGKQRRILRQLKIREQRLQQQIKQLKQELQH